ncbi:FxLYD domain-containing protein [Alkalibacillus salilacus]|uniref:Tetratricopeptide (TPR) repeat protein n=1 Tax=Alkalibacillus salilacus TaxID=284582 RepID=A0ABT9VGG0_9BACI|nr:FxLYD domain-containing protein [Alkalibacillus salilacus]MDQ0160058.1 tetratricopeptide (TPR) repeat protein [Alkalibacillus salilacus]
MMYCPRCGSKTKENEAYCVICGAQLPKDFDDRKRSPNRINRWWFTPLVTLICVLLIAIGLHFYLEYNNSRAQSLYNEGVDYALDGQYSKAQDQFEKAQTYNPNLEAAKTNEEFMNTALEVSEKLTNASTLMEQGAFQQAVQITQEAENDISGYDGEIINQILDTIMNTRNEIRVSQINQRLEDNPGLEELKILIWQAESLEHEEAGELESLIRERIVNHVSNEANEMLQTNQFSAALSLIDDGLRYAPENEQLTSLQSTVENQKSDFETQQQERIEQALSQYELEQEHNENNAVEMVEINATLNEFDEIEVVGEVKSVATRPIHSVSITYTLNDGDENEILNNEVFAYPDTLQPDETGQIDYTHSDLPDDFDAEEIAVNVDQIKWYLDPEEAE